MTNEARDVIDVFHVDASASDSSLTDSSTSIASEPHVRAGDRVPSGWIAEAEREPSPEALRAADVLDRTRCMPLHSPRLPTIPPELAADVARYRAIARRTADCHDGVFRIPHRPNRRCAAWFAELSRGGPAAMHALGIELTQLKVDPNAPSLPCGSNFIGTAAHRAALTLAGFGDASAMPYLLRYLAVQTPLALFEGYDGYAVQLVFDGVRRLARRDIGPVWHDRIESLLDHWTEVVRRWGHWYLAHRSATAASWPSEGVALTRPLLDAPSVSVRYAAYETLRDLESERALLRATREAACAARARDAGGVALESGDDNGDENGSEREDEQMMLFYLCGRGSPTGSSSP